MFCDQIDSGCAEVVLASWIVCEEAEVEIEVEWYLEMVFR